VGSFNNNSNNNISMRITIMITIVGTRSEIPGAGFLNNNRNNNNNNIQYKLLLECDSWSKVPEVRFLE